jgi:SRSO17 transposase
VLERSHWDANALQDMVRDYALETLASPGAVLVIDETGFLKQGQHSCGVGRQYTGSAGKITSCQIGVFATYISDKGCTFINRQLYLPQDWTNKPERRTAAPLPDSLHFVTKPQIATQMVESAIAAGVSFDGVATDTVYGVGKVEMQLRRAGKGMCWAHMPPISSRPGSTNPKWPARPRRLRRLLRPRPGRACMTGPMSTSTSIALVPT